jgi:anti-sigma regulatory factor (Ser/Thr protein kinase)
MIEQEFERNLASLTNVLDFVNLFLAGRDASDEVAFAVTLAVEELFTNTVKYARSSSLPVRLILEANKGKIVICFHDPDVKPFDVVQRMNKSLARSPDEIRPGGLGLLLIKNVMDDVRHEYRDNTNITTMVKYLEPQDDGNHVE